MEVEEHGAEKDVIKKFVGGNTVYVDARGDIRENPDIKSSLIYGWWFSTAPS